MKIPPSALLRDVANACEKYEQSERAMRRDWRAPTADEVNEWNKRRRIAEITLSVLKSALK